MKSVKSINPFKSVIRTNEEIVKAHGGEIKVKAQEGEGLSAEASAKAGTEFFVQL